MSKKAQFYIFAALLLSAFAFTIIQPPVEVAKPLSTFEVLHKNFMRESPVVINNAIYREANVTSAYNSFVDSFIAYSKTRDPRFRLLYILLHDNKIDIGNRLDENVNVTTNTTTYLLQSGNILTINKAGYLSITVGDVNYGFELGSKDVELKGLFKKTQENEVRVHVET